MLSGGRLPPSRAANNRATPIMHVPAITKRSVAPVNGGTSLRPILIASHEVPQTKHNIAMSSAVLTGLGARCASMKGSVYERALLITLAGTPTATPYAGTSHS